MPRRLLNLLTGLSLLLCVAMAVPRHGPPSFRYTGVDPTFHVWNFGWPRVVFIYDARSGIHVGPFAYIVVPPLALALLGGVALSWWLRRPADGLCPPCGYDLRATPGRCPGCGRAVTAGGAR